MDRMKVIQNAGCDSCVASCCIFYDDVMICLEEIADITSYLGLSADEVRIQFLRSVKNVGFLRKEQGRCVFLNENRRCKIYPVRPRTCAEFAINGAQCRQVYVGKDGSVINEGMDTKTYKQLYGDYRQ